MQQSDTLYQEIVSQSKEALFFLAGPCVIESEEISLKVAFELAKLKEKLGCTVVFKSSFDKANRTSLSAFRGPGLEKGLKILEKVKKESGLPIVTDVHLPSEVIAVSEVADILQIPAFLCRQTDLLVAASKSGRVVNVKKGQFMAPNDMRYAVDKAGERVLLTERGTFFGYNRLVVDYAGFRDLKNIGQPVIFDATHSVQIPGGGGSCSTGNRELALPLAKAAVCQGVDGLFFEIHPNPDKALCDGANSISLENFIKAAPKLVNLKRESYGW